MPDQEKWQLFNDRGVDQQIEGRLEAAADCYRQALALNPTSAETWNNLGNVLRQLGRLDEAEASCRRAIALKPLAEANNNLGLVLEQQRRRGEAVAAYQDALAIRPEYAQAHNNLGTALLALGRLEEAAASYRKAIALQSDYIMAWNNLGHALGPLADRERISAYERAAALDPSGIGLDAAVQLAVLAYLADDLERARHWLMFSRPITITTDAERSPTRTYWHYLAKLVSVPKPVGTGPPIYVIGESHALSAHGVLVHYRGQDMRCEARWISGCKQWHLGNTEANPYKRAFGLTIATLPLQSTILLTIGEIDCRPDEGIARAARRSVRPIEQISEATVTGYLDYVARVAAGHHLIIGGVPAPTTGDPEPIRSFNAILKHLARQHGMDFLDVFALETGWHLDEIHLRPEAIAEAFHQIRR